MTLITQLIFCFLLWELNKYNFQKIGSKLSSLTIIDGKTIGATKLNKPGWQASDTLEIALSDVKVPVKKTLR